MCAAVEVASSRRSRMGSLMTQVRLLGVSHDTRFLHWLIDRERDRCCNDRTSSGLLP